jgi:hypothetical protein
MKLVTGGWDEDSWMRMDGDGEREWDEDCWRRIR